MGAVCGGDMDSVVCSAVPGEPGIEICNGIDDNCDMLVDDGCVEDDDGDGVPDHVDNCPMVYNADQLDSDGDAMGDACDDNDDGDSLPDVDDNCPTVVNDDQFDLDLDGLGDACDPDADNDTVVNAEDSDPLDPYVCSDVDSDACDDCSGLGLFNPSDDGPDFDLDGLCDVGDPDDDNDTVADGADADAFDPYVCSDVDGDTCDDCSTLGWFDPSDDGSDMDFDGLCDEGDPDIDGDGWSLPDDCDDYMAAVNPGEAELCDDGIDNDCSGMVDDSPTCIPLWDTCSLTTPLETMPEEDGSLWVGLMGGGDSFDVAGSACGPSASPGKDGVMTYDLPPGYRLNVSWMTISPVLYLTTGECGQAAFAAPCAAWGEASGWESASISYKNESESPETLYLYLDSGETEGGEEGILTLGACSNPADSYVFHQIDVGDAMGICALGRCGALITNPVTDAFLDCAEQCIVDETGVSEGCSTCYRDALECITDNCYDECVLDNGPACDTCIDAACWDALDFCTGTVPSACTGDGCDPQTLLINEIDPDQPGADTAEYVEIYNPGPRRAYLFNYMLDVNDAEGSPLRKLMLLDADAPYLGAGQFLVVGNRTPLVPDSLSLVPSAFTLPDASGALTLRYSDWFTSDSVAYGGAVSGAGEGDAAPADPATGDEALCRVPDGADTENNAADFSICTVTSPGFYNGMACGGVTTAGACDGNLLSVCVEGVLLTKDCAEGGYVCGFNDPYGIYDCLNP